MPSLPSPGAAPSRLERSKVSSSVQSVSVAFEILTGGESLDDWIWRNAMLGVPATEIAERLQAVAGTPVTVAFVTDWLDR
jgi:hypothetical protein